VWRADPAALPDPDGALALLDDEERAVHARFLVEPPRRLYLAAHALVRLTLSRYAEVEPRAWRFARNAYGRPHVAGPMAGRGLHFNLSHTTGLVALAVAATEDVGIDVENTARTLDHDRLAPSVFAPAELAALRRIADPVARRTRFFVLWTLKEAYIKARGMGLSLPLDGFSFDLDGPEPTIAFAASCPDDPARWRFRYDAPTPTHRLALAVPAATDEIRLFRVSLGAEAVGA
jgi:4'-phosphopantetheinyl transferase